MKEPDIEFDFAGWRARLGWTSEQARMALGCSRSYLWKLENAGRGPRMAAWACFGIEAHNRQQRADKSAAYEAAQQ